MNPHAACDRLELQLVRCLLTCDLTEPLDRIAVLALLDGRIQQRIEREVQLAYTGAASDAEVARSLGISRQAARERRLRRAGRRLPHP